MGSTQIFYQDWQYALVLLQFIIGKPNIDFSVTAVEQRHHQIDPLNGTFTVICGRLPLGWMFPRTKGVKRKEWSYEGGKDDDEEVW